jgi:mannosyltransferase OCH1-like enzyme
MSNHLLIQKCISATEKSSYEQKIPKNLFQTFKTNNVPSGMYNAAMSWVNNHPEYSYQFFDDDDCRELINKHFGDDVLDAYNMLSIGAFKADLWRYCVLYVHGGVYVDLDTLSLANLRGIIDADDEFITPFAGMVKGGVFNAVICSIPGHEFLKRAIEEATRLIHLGTADHPLAMTGPLCLGRSINHILARDVNTEFLEGKYDINGYSFKILEKIKSPDSTKRCVAYNGEVVLKCKYDGYEEELAGTGQKHWMGFFK